MLERRRFFPATPVQQVPGVKVELEMQLQPLALQQEDEPCQCDVIGAGWLTSLTGMRDTVTWERLEGQSNWTRYNASAPGWEQGLSVWQGVPSVFGDFGAPLDSPALRCIDLNLSLSAGASPPAARSTT